MVKHRIVKDDSVVNGIEVIFSSKFEIPRDFHIPNFQNKRFFIYMNRRRRTETEISQVRGKHQTRQTRKELRRLQTRYQIKIFSSILTKCLQ